MKKTIAVILLLLVIASVVVVIQFKNIQKKEQEVLKYNMKFEEYNKTGLNGLDITTIINKAVNENEQNAVEKEENGFYKDNGQNSILIDIKMIINGKTYRMEQINELGIGSFTEYFAEVSFDCKDVKYHEETGKISYMLFEATKY